jgi:Domain of unkown function (DUF1775)
MRFSAWSSLGISVSSIAALALAPAAGADVSIVPNSVEKGMQVDLTFAVANDVYPHQVVSVTIGSPPDFELADAEAKPGWTQTHTGQSITWSGGRVPKGQYAKFGIRGTAPPRAERVLFNVLIGSARGLTTTYRVALDVESHPERDAGARTLGKAGLIVAIGAAVLALGAGFLALYVWLRPPPP